MSRKTEDKILRRRVQSTFISTVISISLVLFVLGILGLILLTSEKVSKYVKENIGFTIYLKDNTKEAEIRQLEKQLYMSDFAKETKYIDKKEAAKLLQKELDPNEDFIKFLNNNPLPSSIEVKIKYDYSNADSLVWIEKQISSNAIVKEFSYIKDVVSIIDSNIKKISIILLFFSIILFFVAFALINNSIRLTVYSKRFLIRTMQLVGATRWYIQKPFLIKSIIQGLISSLIALVFVSLFIYFIQKYVPELYDVNDFVLYIKLYLLISLSGIFITFVSTFFAVNKYLRINIDDLYKF